jgi:hypothetical protein
MTKKQETLLAAFNDGVKYERLQDEMNDIRLSDLYLSPKTQEWKLKHKRYFKCIHKAEKLLWKYTNGR